MAENTLTQTPDTSPLSSSPLSLEQLNALRVSPAAHLAEAMAAATVVGERGVAVRELAFLPQLAVRVRPGSPEGDDVAAALGVALPTRRGEVTGDASGVYALWLGPDEFAVVDASRQQEPGEADAASAALGGRPGQVLDHSANRTTFELTGPSARATLEKGCPFDLRDTGLPVGSGVVTTLSGVPVLLHRVSEQGYRISPRSSFAQFVGLWLIDAMEEFAQDQVH